MAEYELQFEHINDESVPLAVSGTDADALMAQARDTIEAGDAGFARVFEVEPVNGNFKDMIFEIATDGKTVSEWDQR